MLFITLLGYGQSFDLISSQEAFQTGINETLKIPIHIRNNTDKPQTYVIRKVQGELTSSQKGYFCIDKNCLEGGIDEFTKRIEPGQTLSNLFYTLETGLIAGQGNFRFEVFVRGSPKELTEYNVGVSIGERLSKELVFQSKDITIHDVYPNPVTDAANMDYRIHNETIKAKVVIHNILGKSVGDYEMPYFENKIKILTEELPAGVYFYTVYLDNSGVLTRKLIVRK
ncbi:MAG TPA: T9SS type A sorting domain-containing protein [Cyclobacteriaceae bacterium]|nr:T9SS type A sorting domain-containing protein [Cyclobacteriaceae bacterium]